jgi:hypothetical protein
LPELPEETFWIMKYNFNCFILLLFKKLKLTFQKIKKFEIFRFIYIDVKSVYVYGSADRFVNKQSLSHRLQLIICHAWNPRKVENWKS